MKIYISLLTIWLVSIMSANADVTTITFSDFYGNQNVQPATDVTSNGYTFSFSKGNAGTEPAYNANYQEMRLYGGSVNNPDGNTMTITSASTMVEIVLSNGSDCNVAQLQADNGTISVNSDRVAIWTGNSSSVTITALRGENATQFRFRTAIILSDESNNNNNFIVDNICYRINDNNTCVSVTRGPMYTGDIVIPDNVTYNGQTYSVKAIDNNAFFYCTELTSLTIPNSVTSIGDYAFYGCNLLSYITIGKSVTSIGESAFSHCGNLTSVIWNAISCNDFLVDTIAPFLGASVMSFVFGDEVEKIPAHLCYWCSGLDSISIPNSVTSIGEGAFSHCISLTSVAIPNSVTSIGSFAFFDCRSLYSIYNHINHPTDVTLGNDVFSGVNKANCTIYVTVGRVEEYRNANQWKEFLNIVDGDWGIYTSSIAISDTTLSLFAYQTAQLHILTEPADASYQQFSWQSSNDEVASVDQNGMVMAHTIGDATITANTIDGSNLSATCEVTVMGATELALNKTSTDIYVGSTDTLTAIISPSEVINQNLIWQSSDTTVAVVRADYSQPDISGTWQTLTNDFDQSQPFRRIRLKPQNPIDQWCCYLLSRQPNGVCDGDFSVNTSSLNVVDNGNNIWGNGLINVGGGWYEYEFSETVYFLQAQENVGQGYVQVLVEQATDPYIECGPTVIITAKAPGVAIITATTTDGTNLSASCNVEVRAYVSSISLNKENAALFIGESETLSATVLPENAFNMNLIWESSDESVATVDQNGKVTALAVGNTTITATTTDGTNLSASCNVEVRALVSSISLNKESTIIFVGESETLSATVLPENAFNKELSWQSSDESIVTVEQDGKVTAIAVGTAIITATTTDGTNLSASCQVNTSYEYGLVSDSIKHTRGDNALVIEYPVELINTNIVSALQFEIELPENVTLQYDGEYADVWLDDTRKARDHNIDVTQLGDNHYQFMISSPTNKDLKGHDGNLFYMKLLVDQYHNTGIYHINYTNLILAEADETEHTAVNTSSTVQFNYMLGDADADTKVDVADYITTALFILNRPTLRFYEDAANVHSANPAINVTDLTGITNIALGIRPTEILYAPALGNASPASIMEPEMNVNVQKLDDDRWIVSLNLSNNQSVAAMQLDLQLPEGMIIDDAKLTGRASNLQLSTGALDDGSARLLASAFSDAEIEPGDDIVLNVVLKGNPIAGGMAIFDNITLAERSLNSHELEPMTVPFTPTAIDGVFTYNEVRIYPENGCIVIESPYAGTAQLVLLNGISAPLNVKAGRNVYPVDKNEYYIVRFNDSTAKLKF